MFAQAFNLCYQSVSWVFSLFQSLTEYFGFGGLLLTLFTIYTIVRLLLVPLFGQALSDSVSRYTSQKSADYRVHGQRSIESKSRVGNLKR